MKTLRLIPLFAGLSLTALSAAEETAAPAPQAVTPPATASCKIHRTKQVQYPLTLLREGVTHGEARILINIDADGKLTESMVLGYTHKPFADAALEVVPAWKFEPARLNGENVGTVADVTFRFEVNGVIFIERNGIPQFAHENFGADYVYRPHGLKTLDGIPTPIQVTQPIYPKDWIDQDMKGKVVIDFYIDETGAVRMPSVLSTDNPWLAAAAAAAVREWRFSPPLRKNRPVLAHCQQVFNFEKPIAATP